MFTSLRKTLGGSETARKALSPRFVGDEACAAAPNKAARVSRKLFFWYMNRSSVCSFCWTGEIRFYEGNRVRLPLMGRRRTAEESNERVY